MLKIFGIRHHGPGSASSLRRALEEWQPDCLLVELPADVEGIVQHVGLSDDEVLQPPVAMLIYNPKNLKQASYLPFAAFSPEWVALSFASQKGIPVQCMDLPFGQHLSWQERQMEAPKLALHSDENDEETDPELRQDPLGYIARLAGYQDRERWWDATFESVQHAPEVFDAILEMMTALREKLGEERTETLLREAFMRKSIRQAVKKGYERIAVVCGAWHAPALADFGNFKVGADNAVLKGLKKVKTTATWIPWSYERLSFESGYGAGVVSPAWYELLFEKRPEAATRWMVKVARMLRKEDMGTSSAHIIEAIRLAEALAAMRGLPLPGIDELREAAISTICEGDEEKMLLVERELLRGASVGKVPPHLKLPTVALLQDIEKEVKSCRLSKYWESPGESWLGATAANPTGGIDLRSESGKRKSVLLHRLSLLDIHWGRRVELSRHHSAGGFLEHWKLHWQPDFIIQIIEAATWGNTLEEACIHYLNRKVFEQESLPQLTALLQQVLDADLPSVLPPLLRKLDNLTALSTDVFELMEALPPLVSVARYGNTRGTDVSAVEAVIRHLVPRILIGLPAAVAQLDEDASHNAFKLLMGVHHALDLLQNAGFSQDWLVTLEKIALAKHTSELLCGACTRILFDKRHFDEEKTEKLMHYALSPATPPMRAAAWLEGFLQGSAQLLLHQQELWKLLDGWVADLNEEYFPQVLPVLRRTFSRYSDAERQRLLKLAMHGPVLAEGVKSEELLPDLEQDALGLVRLILGEE
ncbi:MAG: hypothetical protein CMN32_07570 [Saprospirales bacterium]|nr:hypothetical protein [Saprospirales bacterium]